MKRVGIITLYHNNCNYGGVLQAYALNQTAGELGYDCRTIDYAPVGMPLKEKLTRKIREDGPAAAVGAAVRITGERAARRISRAAAGDAALEIQTRENHLAAFRRDRISHTREYRGMEIRDAGEEFDFFLCGSDQIWNVGPVNSFDPVYWLDFVPDGKGMASYAASMPMPVLPRGEREAVERRLERLDYISVREEQGKELLKPLTEKEIHVAPDPVFLPEPSCWEQLAGESQIREPYLFACLLGDDPALRREIRELADRTGLKIAAAPYLTSCYRKCDRGFGDIRVCGGPEDFLNIIRHASLVLTDSFHASVFSLIFGVPFWAFRRGEPTEGRYQGWTGVMGTLAGGRRPGRRNMDSRLEHLTRTFEISDRLIRPEEIQDRVKEGAEPDFRRIRLLLDQERIRGRKCLQDTFYAMENKRS